MNKSHNDINAEFYNPNKDVVLSRISCGIIPFNKRYERGYYGSIYMKEKSPDYYDSNKI